MWPQVKRVFVSCRLRPSGLTTPRLSPKLEIAYNQELAKCYARTVVVKGDQPIVPILLYPDFLNPEDKAEDDLGVEFCNSDLLTCEEFRFFVDDRGWSCGMLAEFDLVVKNFADWESRIFILPVMDSEKAWALKRAQDQFLKGCHA